MDWKAFLDEVLLDGLLDTLKLLPFLFLTYLLMEFIEHRASDKAERFMQKAGAFGPAVGGLLGLVPQCGFSAGAASLYSGGVITAGTLIAVFLSTSDEMIPIFLSSSVAPATIGKILAAKFVIALVSGIIVDAASHVIRYGFHADKHIQHENPCRRHFGFVYKNLPKHTHKSAYGKHFQIIQKYIHCRSVLPKVLQKSPISAILLQFSVNFRILIANLLHLNSFNLNRKCMSNPRDCFLLKRCIFVEKRTCCHNDSTPNVASLQLLENIAVESRIHTPCS